MYLQLLANIKKQKKNVGNLIPEIETLVQKNNIQIDCNLSIEELMDAFILSYLKVVKKN